MYFIMEDSHSEAWCRRSSLEPVVMSGHEKMPVAVIAQGPRCQYPVVVIDEREGVLVLRRLRAGEVGALGVQREHPLGRVEGAVVNPEVRHHRGDERSHVATAPRV